MGYAVAISIAVPGGLGLLAVLDIHTVADRPGHRLLGGNGLSLGTSLHKGERPVVAVEGDAQPDFGGRDFRQGILHHLAHIGQGSHCHRRTIGIKPYKPPAMTIIARRPFRHVEIHRDSCRLPPTGCRLSWCIRSSPGLPSRWCFFRGGRSVWGRGQAHAQSGE